MILIIFLATLLLAYLITLSRQKRGLPPGPKPFPLIGNVTQLPTVRSWFTYTNWTRVYNSPVIYANALGQSLLIVNGLKDAEELLENRALITSDRPEIPLVHMIGWSKQTFILGYGDTWRKHRRILHKNMRHEVVPQCDALMSEKALRLLHNLAQTPEGFFRHCKIYAVSITLDLLYGYDIGPNGDPSFDLAERVLHRTNRALQPGVFAVNSFPMLKHLPRWFPGAGFHDFADEVKAAQAEMRDKPFDFAKTNYINGVGRPSFVGKWLQEEGTTEEQEDLLSNLALGIYGAAFETTAAALTSLFHVLVTHPEVQLKAQKEISRVIGEDRLPTLQDRAHLPYLEAVYREILRWRPPLPLNVPHRIMGEDSYKGYLIPSGTVIIANIWAMTHNESIYPEPEVFRPERFLNLDGSLNDDSRVFAYGFGRRICPGKHLASASFWLAMAQVLASFHVSPAKDASGKEIEVTKDHEYSDELISAPVEFECSIKPRRALEEVLGAE
ncbi:cytochrome P450 [Pluteus cervinus]|uniref:Cytochrome P450 n=1 Tax=Pluteus cervinus TaxID=181527 RepID=A0ACD3B814_9AGAR|nr:cytochrome P450 [Pluteus cervinus]